jgi:O-antigen/teichoic acid export membrane protein
MFLVVLFWFSADYLAINYFKDFRAGLLLKVLAFYLPLNIILINFTSIFQGLKKSIYLSILRPVLNGAILLGVLVGIYFRLDIFAPVLGYLGSLIILFLIFIIPLLKSFNYFKFNHKNFIKENKKLLRFSFPLMITGIGGLFIAYFDTAMLTFFDTLTNVGIYNIIYPTALLITMLGSSIGVILLPILTELWSLNKKKDITNAIKIINKLLIIVCLPLMLILMTFSKDLIRVFFGEDYLSGVLPFNILLAGALFSVLSMIFYQLLVALKESKKSMKVYLYGGVLNIILNLILIPYYSLLGAAISSALSFLLMLYLSFYYSSKKIKIISPWKSWLITCIVALIIPTTPWIMNRFINMNIYVTTISGLILGGVVYLIILYKLNIIDVMEIKKIFFK